jgi:hypothetical protein
VSDSSNKSTKAISERAMTKANPWRCGEEDILEEEGNENISIKCGH